MSIVYLHKIFKQNADMLGFLCDMPVKSCMEPGHKWYVLLGAHECPTTLITFQETNKCKFIILNTESYMSQFMRNKFYLQLLRTHLWFDYNLVNRKHVQVLGIQPVSMFPILFEEKHSINRDIDILFVGSKTDRRQAIFDKLVEAYPDKHIVFDFEWTDTPRTRAKVVVNIPYYEHTILETHRVHEALACGCKVVSLYTGDEAVDNFYADYITFCHDMVEVFETDIPNPTHDWKHLKTKMDLPQFAWLVRTLVKKM